MHELRALEVIGVRHADDGDGDGDERDRDQDRVGERVAAGALIAQHAELIGAERENQREQRTPGKIDPDLVDRGQGCLASRRSTRAGTAIVSTTLTRSASATASPCDLSCGRKSTTPTAAGTKSRPRCCTSAEPTRSTSCGACRRAARDASRATGPTTGPGMSGSKKFEASSPAPWKSRIWTSPEINLPC